MAEIIDLNLHRKGTALSGLVDPCSECDKPLPCSGCERANAWWDQFAKAFSKRVKGE